MSMYLFSMGIIYSQLIKLLYSAPIFSFMGPFRGPAGDPLTQAWAQASAPEQGLQL
jgi:hypothetical protein